jgi:zinc transporter 1/2/3
VSLQRIGTGISRARKLILGFAIMTPLGIMLGTGISALLDSTGEQVFEALFDAIAAGTFLYIASLDIIREEFLPPRSDRRIKWLWAAIGLTLMAIVAIWT